MMLVTEPQNLSLKALFKDLIVFKHNTHKTYAEYNCYHQNV